MKRYTVKEFEKKYAGRNHISCGVHYADGTHDCVANAPFSWIADFIKNKKVVFIISK